MGGRAGETSIYRLLVEQSPDGHFVVVDDFFAYLNPSAMRMFGISPDEIPGLPVASIIHPSDRERALRNVGLRRDGVLQGAITYLAVRRDGTAFPIETNAGTLDYHGKRAVHGTIRDVTARRKMEDRLERMERAGLVSRLASGLAHDFNNLLAVIQSNAELARDEVRSAAGKNALMHITSAVHRGSEKVDHLRRMGATAGVEKLRPLYLNPIVEEVLDLTKPRWRAEAESRGIHYDVRWVPGLPPPVLGSPTDLRSALVALVFNAVEAMPEGGPITIRTGRDTDGQVLVTVQDEGEGIPPAHLPRLTDGFFTTRPDREMGLGLSLVQSVVARHGGRLEVDSEPGRGSTFALIMPRSEQAPSEPPPAPRPDITDRPKASLSEVPRPRTRGGRSVLLIDDQADLVQVVSTILEGRGYSVDSALNGTDGLALAEVTRYSVVLTDLGMPDLSGFEVAQRVRSLQPQTPVILMTGWAAEVDPDRLDESGIVALLPKPFRSEDLLQTVNDAIQGRLKGS